MLAYGVLPTDTQLVTCVPRQTAAEGVGVGVLDKDGEITGDADAELDDGLITVLNVV